MESVADLLTHARLELARSKQRGDPEEALLARRQAAEKAWGHLLERIDTLLHVRAKDDTAHDERRERLQELESGSGVPLLAAYFDLQRVLHGDCFCRGRCPLGEVERAFQAAIGFPDRLEAALRRAGRWSP